MDTGRKRVIELGILYRGARDAYGKHRQGCYECHVAHRDSLPMRYCATGWELAKAATKTHNDLERARGKRKVRDRGEQEALF